jgi:hypothetical protein
MYAPRRHSRRLLLPPGWVALGFLLLLGCQALLAHRRQLRQERILQLVMPFYSKEQAQAYEEYGRHYSIGAYKPLAGLINTPRWCTISLTGKPLNDFLSITTFKANVLALARDTSSAGIQVSFAPGATYGSLLRLLDIMESLGYGKYWFDIHGKEPIFYSIGRAVKSKPIIKESSPRTYRQDFCGTSDYQIRPDAVPTRPTSSELLHSWQPATLLFAALSILNIYRLARSRPSLR